MNELFENLFAGRGIPRADIEKYAADFSGIIFLGILGAAENRLDEKDRQKIAGFMNANDFASVLELVRAKYSEKEWEAMLTEETGPFLDRYIREVIPA